MPTCASTPLPPPTLCRLYHPKSQPRARQLRPATHQLKRLLPTLGHRSLQHLQSNPPRQQPPIIRKLPHHILPSSLSTSQHKLSSHPSPAPTPAAVSYRDRSALADDKNVIDMSVRYNPYPSIHQSVIQPLDPSYYAKTTPTREERLREEQLAQQRNNMPPNTSTNTVSPDIIRLASNSDLSVAAIANEANRIQHQEQASQDDDDEIVIPLR